jgi:tetratricopeptide (TPR) repeat protein
VGHAPPDAAGSFAAALAQHRAGRLRQAEQLYRGALTADPGHADSLHLLGVLASQTGRHSRARHLIAAAIARAPGQAVYHTNLGNVLLALGRPAEAADSHRRALMLDPALADAHRNLGGALQRQGDAVAAADSFGAALALRPDDAESRAALGAVLVALGRLAEAEACWRTLIAQQPDHADAHNNLGSVLLRQDRPEAAVACYRAALALQPRHVEASLNLGDALRVQGRSAAALACYRTVIAARPHHAGAHNKLGVALLALDRPAEAAAAFQAAIRLRPDDPEAHSNLAVAQTRLRQPAAAIDSCRLALRLRPDHGEAHNNLALALLASGDFAAGWQEYEWRWQVAPLRALRRDFAQPQWHGAPGAGQTLLVHAEQGYGDTLQFCRLAPLARQRGLRVIVEAPRPLLRLLQGLPGIDALVAAGDALPPFDLHVPMLSLPRALGVTLAANPVAMPYLAVAPAAVAAWRARLAPDDAAGPRIGLAWAGSPRPDWAIAAGIDRRRSLPPERLAPLLAIPGLQFFSLQKDGPAAPADVVLVDPMAEMDDFADTAALVANLDLVITVDTAVAHLAGALGRPVCLLDRFDHCWRWLAGRSDSPWYPSMRIYRQPAPGDWEPVLTAVAADLHALAAAWRAAWQQYQGVARPPEAG